MLTKLNVVPNFKLSDEIPFDQLGVGLAEKQKG